MAPDKSLAAEIEAVLRDQIVLRWMGPDSFMEGHEEAARIIAARFVALQTRAFEDGARWMRERAAEVATHRYSPLNLDQFNVNNQLLRNSHGHDRFMSVEEADRHVSERVAAIRSIPLQTEGERNA